MKKRYFGLLAVPMLMARCGADPGCAPAIDEPPGPSEVICLDGGAGCAIPDPDADTPTTEDDGTVTPPQAGYGPPRMAVAACFEGGTETANGSPPLRVDSISVVMETGADTHDSDDITNIHWKFRLIASDHPSPFQGAATRWSDIYDMAITGPTDILEGQSFAYNMRVFSMPAGTTPPPRYPITPEYDRWWYESAMGATFAVDAVADPYLEVKGVFDRDLHDDKEFDYFYPMGTPSADELANGDHALPPRNCGGAG